MTALAAREIRKAFGRHEVLAGLDLDIAAGEMVAVVGENGSSMIVLSLAWTAAFALLGFVVLRLRMPHPAGAAARSA